MVRRRQPELRAGLHTQLGTWTTSQPTEISAATSFGISPDIFIGGEIRHITQNEHGFFSEHALFVGPSVYVKLWENADVKFAWSAQIPDETTHTIDLVNYANIVVWLKDGKHVAWITCYWSW
jgi:hypothetical protein